MRRLPPAQHPRPRRARRSRSLCSTRRHFRRCHRPYAGSCLFGMSRRLLCVSPSKPSVVLIVSVSRLTIPSAVIVGCVSSSSVGSVLTSFLSTAASFPYDGQQICTSTDGVLFCSKSACSTCTTNSLWTGCVDISVSYSYYWYYSSYSYSVDTLTYIYTYNYSASAYVTTWTGDDTTSVRTETSFYTITESDVLTSPISSVLIW